MQTITKIFSQYNNATQAVRDLEASGIPSESISIVANQDNLNRDGASYELGGTNRASGDTAIDGNAEQGTEAGVGAGLGAAMGGTAGLLTGLGIMAIPGVGPVVAAGWLATLALGAVAGGATGGILGSLIGSGISDEDAHVYSESLRRGSTLLSVKVDESRVDQVHAILNQNQPVDPVGLGTEYRNSGWNNFDPEGGIYASGNSPAEQEMRDQTSRDANLRDANLRDANLRVK